MRKISFALLALFLSSMMLSCSNDDNVATPDDNDSTNNNNQEFVIAATPQALEGVADYLLTVDDLSQGTVSLLGKGIEQDGTYRYYVTSNNTFFSLLYGQGNPGAVTAYKLGTNNKLKKLTDFQSETVQAFAPVNDDVLMIKVSRNITDPTSQWFQLDTKTLEFTNQGQLNTKQLAGNGELAHFTWLTQVGDKVFAPYMSIKGNETDGFGTAYPDSAWIAVYDYPSMDLNTVIRDGRTSYIGRYFVSGLGVVENGDVYAFSSGVATTNGEPSSTKPSAITRIKSGTLTFDSSYYYDLEEASGGYYETEQRYVGNGLFLLTMRNTDDKAAYSSGGKLAIVNVLDKTFTWVTGTPAPDKISNISMTNLIDKENAKVYMGITTDAGSYVYTVDINNATATQGIQVKGGTITAISSLNTEN